MVKSTKKVAIVTGGAGDIGKSIVETLRQISTVVVVDIVPVTSTPFEATEDVVYEQVGVTDEKQVESMVKRTMEKFGRIDILVNCAGGFREKRQVWDLSLEEWNEIVDVNLTGTFICSKGVLPIMREQHRGRIINISSTAGRTPDQQNVVAYAAAKAGVLGFTRALAREVGPDGITVNAVCPGSLYTPRLLRIRGEEELKQIAERTPVRRIGYTEDIARVIPFLAADEADYITGATFDINGGRIMM